MNLEQDIRDKIADRKNCKICPLYSPDRKQVIYEILNQRPHKYKCDILFIGINPGKDEAKQNRPFIGRSGQILRKAISDIGLDSKYRIGITNAILCSTNNEKEIPDVAKCIKHCNYLFRCIRKKLNPDILVPVGASCAGILFGSKRPILSQSGYPLEDNPNVIPILHPASLLYRPDEQNKAKFVNSLKRIKEYYKTNC